MSFRAVFREARCLLFTVVLGRKGIARLSFFVSLDECARDMRKSVIGALIRSWLKLDFVPRTRCENHVVGASGKLTAVEAIRPDGV
jgi:hypothetical protein